MKLIYLITCILFSSSQSLTDVKVISYGLLPVKNTGESYLENNHVNSFAFNEIVPDTSNFSVSFTGWIQADAITSIPNYQSKIQAVYNSSSFGMKGMIFGNNSTHFIVRQDYSSSTSHTQCQLPYISNQRYSFFISWNQNSTFLKFFLALRAENGTLFSTSSEKNNSINLVSMSTNFLVAFQFQKPADTYASSTQMMGAITVIKSYFYSQNDPHMQRFLLNFSPNSFEVFNFQFSYEQAFCNCIIDYSQNTLRGELSVPYKTLKNLGGVGFYSFGFAQNEEVSWNSGKLRFGAQADSLYRDITYSKLTPYWSTQSITLSFWMNISSSVQSFTVFRYITLSHTFNLSLTSVVGGSLYQLQLLDGSTPAILSSSLAPNFYNHFIISISYSYLDFYLNGTFNTTIVKDFTTFFQGGVSESQMKIGGQNYPTTSLVQISQFRLFSSNAVLASSTFSNLLTSNCMALIQNRTQTYSCLICQSGYYLYGQSCTSNCQALYNKLEEIRLCAPKCPNGCSSCDPMNPLICLTCQANRIPNNNKCECPQGTFEDYRMSTCFCKILLFHNKKDNLVQLLFVENFLHLLILLS